LTIGFVYPGPDDEFWLNTARGASAEGQRVGNVKVISGAGAASANFADMIPVVESMLTRGVDAIIAPGGPQLLPVLKRATSQGIPVILYATGLPQLKNAKSTIITNNFQGGIEAGNYLKKLLRGSGTLGILDIERGTYPLLDQRAAGVLQAIKGSHIRVVGDLNTQCDVATAVSVAENMLTRTPNLNAFFGACAQAALGAVQALKTAPKGGHVVTVGFDGKRAEFSSILAGSETATIAQQPARMGALAVQIATQVLRGMRVPAQINVATSLVTKQTAASFLAKTRAAQ
jgi:ABC-type sugar transport system substrate-binding protein